MAEKASKITSKYREVTNTINSIRSATEMYKTLKEKYEEKFLYTATLDENGFVYSDMMRYIDTETKQRNFKFLSGRAGITRYYDSSETATFYIGDHKIKAMLNKPETASNGDDTIHAGLKLMTSMNSSDELYFTCRTAEGLDALQNLMEEMGRNKQVKEKTVYLISPDSYGDWDHNLIPKKTLDSVFLPDGVKEGLIGDIEKFLASEKKFVDIGIPWHRGYAFYGQPGNGKSSIALALANHFGLDLYNLPLSAVKDDKTLARAIGDIKARSILLLEDIDIFSNTMKREQQGSKEAPTLAGLLNALDGVGTPHGLITIMTTNNFDKLDSALVRPGRMDYTLELKPPVQEQIEGLFYRVFEEPLGIDAKPFDSMAQVSDVFKRNLEDPEAARLELKNE